MLIVLSRAPCSLPKRIVVHGDDEQSDGRNQEWRSEEAAPASVLQGRKIRGGRRRGRCNSFAFRHFLPVIISSPARWTDPAGEVGRSASDQPGNAKPLLERAFRLDNELRLVDRRV